MKMKLRTDLAIIAEAVPEGRRVLDVGCGDGTLLSALRRERNVDARGLELDAANVTAAIAAGESVVQGDANHDLDAYPDDAFDYAILSQTLQTTERPDLVIEQLLRIAPRAFVMPVTRLIPVAWYETPNIHHLTVADFRHLMVERDIKVENAWFLSGDRLINDSAANWRAEHAIYQIARR
jgi:ubiquinone/menaquinone biosynthesis C-methylase UbiE